MTCEELMSRQNNLLQTIVDSNNSISKNLLELILELKKLNRMVGV